MQSFLLAIATASARVLKRGLPVVLALSILPCASIPSNARGMGRFLGSLVARGAVREAIVAGRSESQSFAPKAYTADVLTVAQLATCIKKASKLDEDSDRLEASRTVLLSSKSDIDMARTAIEFQRPRVDHYSQKSVDAFNALINRYNMLVTAGKAKQVSFNALVDTHNTEADAYNTECVKKYYADDLPDAQKIATQP